LRTKMSLQFNKILSRILEDFLLIPIMWDSQCFIVIYHIVNSGNCKHLHWETIQSVSEIFLKYLMYWFNLSKIIVFLLYFTVVLFIIENRAIVQ
jgi:hypothetical protein